MLCGKATDSQNILCTLICIIKQSARTYLCVRVCFFSHVQAISNETHQTQWDGEEEKWC